MKKAFDQTFRDIKRGVNKKVLKVPGIEQKVLDATSNEPWGPHGTLLADIAQATRNYHEYQMIIGVIWKRINDTGKNWRHVYKALTVLEYLVAHGSERVIDDIREHSYQISTLSDFQYIDSSGRDQGSNVRKKSQSLVALVNDKERIIEVRQKAAANRDKFRNTTAGGMYRPGSYSSSGGNGDRYDNDRYEGRYGNDDQNGYGREREYGYGYRDDDRSSRNGDSYSRDGDRYGRDYEDRYSRDVYRDDDYRGRSRSVDAYQDGSSRNSDDGQLSSRGLERKFSEQNIGAPPSYEEAVSESRSPVHSERDGESSASAVPPPGPPGVLPPPARLGASSPPAAPGAASPPPAPGSSSPPAAPGASSPPASHNPNQATNTFDNFTSANQEAVAPDEFDPRGSVQASASMPTAAALATSNSAEIDLLGSLSDSFSSNALAIMPSVPVSSTTEAEAFSNSGAASIYPASQSASNVVNQTFEDPFGDTPFKALPSTDNAPAPQQTMASTAPFHLNQNAEMPQPAASQGESVNNFEESFYGMTYSAPNVPNVQPSPGNSQFLPQELSTSQQDTDVLADILPPPGPSPAAASQVPFSTPAGQPAHSNANIYGSFQPQTGSMSPAAPYVEPQMSSGSAAQFSNNNFISQGNSAASVTSYMAPQTPAGPTAQFNSGNFLAHQGSAVPAASQFAHQNPAVPVGAHQDPTGQAFGHQNPAGPASGYQHPTGPAFGHQNLTGPVSAHQNPNGSAFAHQNPTGPTQQNNDLLNNFLPQAPTPPVASQPVLPSSTGSLAIVPQPQQSKAKFEPKSAVWADTLSRGLVNLNISGPKTNPLADIGVDFDAINRKERRMEKQPPQQAAVTSTITMGKAMGSGSGLGRAGTGILRAPPNTAMGSSLGMGMSVGLQDHDSSFYNRMVKDAIFPHQHNEFGMVLLPVSTTWKNLRKLCNLHIFTTQKLDANQELRRKKIKNLLSYVEENCRAGKAIDISQVVFNTSLNLLSNTIFSVDLADDTTERKFKDTVSSILVEIGKPNLSDHFPLLKRLDLQGIRSRMTFYFGKMLEVFDGLIDQRLKQRQQHDYNSTSIESKDVLGTLLDIIQDKSVEIDRNYMKHLFLDLFVAGTDTTSSTLEWAMAELLRSPDALSKARLELEQTIGKGKTIEESDITRLPYLQAVVKETLRLHPAVPLLLPRKALADVEIAGFIVPKGAQVFVNAWAIGRDELTWENPLSFMPERFLGSNLDFKGRNFELIPFGSGRRICPGLPLAIRMLHLMLGSLINSFDWKLEDENMDMEEKFGITLQKAQPLRVIPVAI